MVQRIGLTSLLVACMLLAACAQSMNVTATFSDARGLERGTPVYLEDERVGEVSEVNDAVSGTQAALSLDPERVGSLRSGSAALLTTRGPETVIELYNHRSGHAALADGDELAGLSNSLEFAAWQMGQSLAAGRQSMGEMAESVTGYFQSEEWRRQKQRMNEQLEDLETELGRAYDETSRAYEEYLRNLESESEAARQRVREAYAELVEQLRAEIERLTKEGNEAIVEPLRRLLEDLSRAMQQQPEQRSI